MANFVERISVIIDSKVDSAQAGLKKLRADVSAAEGAVGKFKAGFANLTAGVKANAGLLAASAGTALVAFGVKAVGAFNDTAKAAVDMSRATGLSVEQASRWIAVGDDYEVTAQQLATAMGRIGKELDSDKWEKYGIATRDASGNARDANAIFLDVLETLNNTAPAERAKVGADLLGKGWQGVAPILGHTRSEYEKMLGSVEDGQVVTEKEAKQSEKMRLAADRFSDSVGELALSFGALLSKGAPVVDLLSDLAVGASTLADVVVGSDLAEPVSEFAAAIGDADTTSGEGIANILNNFSTLVDEAGRSRSALDKTGKVTSTFFGELLDQGTAATIRLEDFKKAFKALFESDPQAARQVYEALQGVVIAAENGSESAMEWVVAYSLVHGTMQEFGGMLGVLSGQFDAAHDAGDRGADGLAGFSHEARVARDEAKEAAEKIDDLNEALSDISEDQAAFDLEGQFIALREAADEAFYASVSGSEDAADAQRDYQGEILQTREEVARYLQDVLKLPEDKVTKLLTELDRGNFDYVEAELDRLARNRSVGITAYVSTAGASSGGNTGGLSGQSGGLGGSKLEGVGRGGTTNTFNITINAAVPVSASPAAYGQAIADALQAWWNDGGRSGLFG